MTFVELHKYRCEIPAEPNKAKVFLRLPDGSEIQLPELLSVTISQKLNEPGKATIEVLGAYTK